MGSCGVVDGGHVRGQFVEIALLVREAEPLSLLLPPLLSTSSVKGSVK